MFLLSNLYDICKFPLCSSCYVVLIGAVPLCYSIFIKYFIQSQCNINIWSIIHSFGYMFCFHQTILRPIFIIWMYIQYVCILWDPKFFTLIKAKIIPVFNNFNSRLMYFFFKSLTECIFKNIYKNSYQCIGTFIVKLMST